MNEPGILMNNDIPKLPILTISAFSPLRDIWLLLKSRNVITFREYANSSVPPDYLQLNDHDLESTWKDYPGSLVGLQTAIIDIAIRLIEWKFCRWCDQNNNHTEYSSIYKRIVSAYQIEIIKDLRSYFGINRFIEASSCYSRFLVDEQTLLACSTVNTSFDWEFTYKSRRFSKPMFEVPPIEFIQLPEHVDKNSGYSFKRINYASTRINVVVLDHLKSVTSLLLAEWLNKYEMLIYRGNTIFSPESCGSVWMTSSSTGRDRYAGDIGEPNTILNTLLSLTESNLYC